MTTPEDVARVLKERMRFPSRPETPPALSPEAMRTALALHGVATSIAAMTPEQRAEVERACAVLGVSVPVVTL